MLVPLILILVRVCYSDIIHSWNDDTFDKKLQNNDYAFVMFHGNEKFESYEEEVGFTEAGLKLDDERIPIPFVRVDCSKTGFGVCNEYSISKRPSFLLFENGVPKMEYSGNIDRISIADYVRNFYSELKYLKDNYIDSFIKEPTSCLIGYFKIDNSLKQTYLEVYKRMRGKIRFGLSTKLDISLEPGIISLYKPKYLHNKYEETFLLYNGKDDPDKLEEWVKENQHGLVGHRRHTNTETFQQKAPLVVVYTPVDFETNLLEIKYIRSRILKLAIEFKNSLTFATSPAFEFLRELVELGYQEENPIEDPVLSIRAYGNKYVLKNPPTMENMRKFCKRFLKKQLKPYILSEPIPEQKDEVVIKAVARNFKEVILDNGKDTLIYLYATYCTKCARISEIWESLGREMAGEDIIIARMNKKLNDVPTRYQADGFPIIWAPKYAKDQPIVYQGQRTLPDLIQFIAKHATVELNKYARNGRLKKAEL